MKVLACPADGQLLDGSHNVGGGRFECPRCDRRWEAWEVAA